MQGLGSEPQLAPKFLIQLNPAQDMIYIIQVNGWTLAENTYSFGNSDYSFKGVSNIWHDRNFMS